MWPINLQSEKIARQEDSMGKPPRVFDTPSRPDAVFFEWFFDPCCLLACEIRKSPKSGVRNPGAIFSDRRLLNWPSTCLEKYLSRKYLNWKIPAEWVLGLAEWVAGLAVKLGIFSDFRRGATRLRQKSKKML